MPTRAWPAVAAFRNRPAAPVGTLVPGADRTLKYGLADRNDNGNQSPHEQCFSGLRDVGCDHCRVAPRVGRRRDYRPTTRTHLAQCGLALSKRRPSGRGLEEPPVDRKSTRLNSSHLGISYAVFCLKKKNKYHTR